MADVEDAAAAEAVQENSSRPNAFVGRGRKRVIVKFLAGYN